MQNAAQRRSAPWQRKQVPCVHRFKFGIGSVVCERVPEAMQLSGKRHGICQRSAEENIINQQYAENFDHLHPSYILHEHSNYLSGLMMLRALLARLLVCESVKQGAEEKENARGCRSAG